MKKILLTFIILVIASIGYLYKFRYLEDKTSIGPMPFEFSPGAYAPIKVDAPILIVGDMMAQRLSKFKELLENSLAKNYTQGIKVESIATEGESIYRTLHKIKSLKQVPLIILLMSNQDTFKEQIFKDKDLALIKDNIKLFKNEYIKTLLMIFPDLAKIIYTPVRPIKLTGKPNKETKAKEDSIYQNRKLVHYALYDFALEELINYTKKANSLVINITTPLNLSLPPAKSCDGSISKTSLADLEKAESSFKKNDYKLTYNLSKELILLNPYHARSQYLLSQSAFKLQKFREYQNSGSLALSLDCKNQGGDPVLNSIMIKLAKQYEVALLDFDKLIVDQSKSNFTFIEDIYPQDLYFEKIISTVSSLLKKRLRLAQ